MTRRAVAHLHCMAITVIYAAVIAGCRSGDTEQSEAPAPPEPVTRIATGGPVQMTVTLENDDIVVGDAVRLTIELTFPAGHDVNMPVIEEQLGPFDVDAADRPPDIPIEDGRRWRHTYTLSTFESGEIELPAIEAGYLPPDATEEDQPVALATEPIPVQVKTALAEGESAEELRDIQGAVDVPVERPLPWYWLAVIGFAALTALGIVLLIFFVRSRLKKPAPPLTPHGWALQQLRALRDAGLIERGEADAFYTRLSHIVRVYIERRFALRAPEQTTEEFLRDVQRSRALSEGHKVLLARFLRAADLVKFALHQPSPAEAEDALESAERFVRDTAPREETPANGRPPTADTQVSAV